MGFAGLNEVVDGALMFCRQMEWGGEMRLQRKERRSAFFSLSLSLSFHSMDSVRRRANREEYLSCVPQNGSFGNGKRAEARRADRRKQKGKCLL